MYPYLKNIQDKRYIEILRLLNIDSVKEKNKPNLFMDAYHLLTAEKAGCRYFLTTDSPILNQFSCQPMKAISPCILAKELGVISA